MDQLLYEIGEAVRVAALLLLPVMPTSCAEVLRRVGEHRPVDTLRLDDAAWSAVTERQIAKGDPLWPRLEPRPEETTLMNQPETRTLPDAPTPDAPASAEPGIEQISIDQFVQVEMRIGRVVAAEAVPKSRRLLKVQLDTGSGERQVVAGIAGSYEPEALVGRTVVFVANLKPVKLAGVESNGMMLAASDPEGKPVLLTVDDPAAAPPGSKILVGRGFSGEFMGSMQHEPRMEVSWCDDVARV